jgi:uncharacterized OB-fold protein
MKSIFHGASSEDVSLPGEAIASDASGRAVLIGSACRSCGARMFPAAPVCSTCMSEDLTREAMPRRGTLYSFTAVHVGPKNWQKPYMLGYVDLENGVRVFSHLRGALTIGETVELTTAVIGQSESGAKITTFIFQPTES